ncbi:MAG: hypothetical protein R2862_09525 [Thermoanaerobaculia bacterium]
MVNSANALFVPLLGGRDPDCPQHRRNRSSARWGAFGRAVYALSERLACMI